MDDLPPDTDWQNLEDELAQASLYRGDLATACDLAEKARRRRDDAFWLKVAVMCAAANSDRASVDFQLGILEETEAVSPAFYALSDMLLIEAEIGSSGDRVLGSALALDSLSVAMARLAKARITQVDLVSASPLALQAALVLPGLDGIAREEVSEAALKQVMVDPVRMAADARSRVLADGRKATLFVDAETDPSFVVDFDLLTLLSASAEAELDRRSALEALWRRSGPQTRMNLAPVLVDLAADLPVTGEASDVVRVRAALAAGNGFEANRYFAALRTVGQLDRPETAAALVEVAPLMALFAEDADLALSADLLARWADAGQPTRDKALKAALLLSVAEGLGFIVTEESWVRVGSLVRLSEQTQGALAVSISQVAAPLVPWRKLVKARLEADKPALYAAAMELLTPDHPLRLSPAMVGSVIAALRESGDAEAARLLALDLLIRAGI